MVKDVLIAGGGIIGLTTAYYLSEAGHRVTIIDKNDFLTNCSTGNAGLIVPSHFVPLASPGIIWQGIKWIFDAKSPFSINFRPDINLAKWGIRFYASSTKKNVQKASPVLFRLNTFSKELYKNLSQNPKLSLNYTERGLLMLSRSHEKQNEEVKMAAEANKLGIKAQVLNLTEIKALEPNTEFDVAGGVYYPEDANINPDAYIKSLIAYLKSENVTLLSENELIDISIRDNKAVNVITSSGSIVFDELVIAGGVHSQKIFNRLGIKTQVQAGKGYSFELKTRKIISNPLILTDARVAITPFGELTRFTGAMEIGGIEGVIKEKKIQGMVESIEKFIPGSEISQPLPGEVWSGLRPCSVDGLPYIGRINKYRNIIVATGHSMMGVSLAPATGKLIEELISEKKPQINLEPFHPER